MGRLSDPLGPSKEGFAGRSAVSRARGPSGGAFRQPLAGDLDRGYRDDAVADVVNLNRFRKRKRREADQREAERNRVVHGRSKAEKQALRLERERAERALAAHEREGDDAGGSAPDQT